MVYLVVKFQVSGLYNPVAVRQCKLAQLEMTSEASLTFNRMFYSCRRLFLLVNDFSETIRGITEFSEIRLIPETVHWSLNASSRSCHTHHFVCSTDISCWSVRTSQEIRYARFSVAASCLEWIYLWCRQSHRRRACLGKSFSLQFLALNYDIFASCREMSTRLWLWSKTRSRWP